MIGEMISGNDQGKRFCATTYETDRNGIDWLLSKNRIGDIVTVECDGIQNQFGGYRNYFIGPTSASKM